jgi:hypothetical protein
VTVPAVGDVNVTVHVPPVVPAAVALQVSSDTSLCTVASSVRVTATFVPLGAGPKPSAASPPGAPAGKPSFWKTEIVQTCGSPTVFVSS